MLVSAISEGNQGRSPPFVPPSPEDTLIRPWVRFWARHVDMVLGVMLLRILVYLIRPTVLESDPSPIFVPLLLLLCTVLNAGCLAAWGTTPGKWLLATSVRDKEGQRPPFWRALHREVAVWVKGLGGGLPFLQLICFLVAYGRLKEKGETTWDAETGLVVFHDRIATWRVIVVGVLLTLVTVVQFLN